MSAFNRMDLRLTLRTVDIIPALLARADVVECPGRCVGELRLAP